MKRLIANIKGFTLIELMVALALLGLVIMAISTTFLSQRRSGVTQEEVSEAQQSVRIGLETLVRDIKTAGLMISNTATSNSYPIENTGDFSTTILVGSTADGYATIVDPADEDGNITGLSSPITFTVDTARDFLNNEGADVRVIRPSMGIDAGDEAVCYTVSYISPTSLRLTYKSGTLPAGGIPGINYRPGDTIILNDCTAVWPIRIRYYLNPDPAANPGTTVLRNLERHMDTDNDGAVNGAETAEVIAANIIVPDADADGVPDLDANGLIKRLFRYLNSNGNETANRDDITAVNVNITTATTRDVARINSEARTRQLTSLVRLRNKH